MKKARIISSEHDVMYVLSRSLVLSTVVSIELCSGHVE